MYAIFIKGHYPDIAFEEVNILCKTYGRKILLKDNRIVVVDGPFPFERLAYSHLAIELIAHGDFEDIMKSAEGIVVEDTFAVRGSMNLAVKIGGKIRGKVDLSCPETEFYILEGNQYYFGKLVWKQDKKGLIKRFQRIFYHPTNLKPELARVLVNLTGIKEREKLIDPFCGAGSILIEAADMGIKATGIDIDERMVEGCRENIEHLGYEAEIIQGDAFELVEEMRGAFQGLSTDIPYGRSSSLSGKKKSEFLERLPNILEFLNKGKAVIMSDMPLNFQGKVAEFKIRVHGSLTRFVNIFEVL